MSKTRQTRTNQVMRHRNVVLELRCDLTLEEQRLKGVQLAEQEHKIAELEDKDEAAERDHQEGDQGHYHGPRREFAGDSPGLGAPAG
jgi:hypothetical protein